MRRSRPYAVHTWKKNRKADPDTPTEKKLLNATRALLQSGKGFTDKNSSATVDGHRPENIHTNVVNPSTKIRVPILSDPTF
jgi:hypothetical protein